VSLLAAGAAALVSAGLEHGVGAEAGTAGRLVDVGLGILVGLIVFAASALILRIEEAEEVRDAVLRRFRR
jgi:hypothetical protein